MVRIIERLSGHDWVPPWIYYQHVARYQWAAPLTQGKRVLDAACGTGYGGKMLVDGGAESVHGFDLSPEAIQEAKRAHPSEKLRFEVGDVTNLPVADEQYDVYVSFETIEHVADDRGFVKEVCRVLKPKGTFLCSTPNRRITNPGTAIADHPYNPFHLREYTRDELKDLLAPHFASIVFFCQSTYARWYGKVLNAIGRRVPRLAVRLHQIRKTLGMPFCRLKDHYPQGWDEARQPEVLIAVCTAVR